MPAQHKAPVKVIIDTDMGGGGCQDADDVGTLCMANAMADSGEIELLAIVLDTLPDASAAAIGVLQRHFGREDVPVGVLKASHPAEHLKFGHHYTEVLAENWPSSIKGTSELPSAVDVYRRVLAAQSDRSVVVASVGVLTNLAELLQSGPDEHSSLTGAELLEAKVRLLAVMGGRWPQGDECNLCECNLFQGCATTGAAKLAVSLLPASLSVVTRK